MFVVSSDDFHLLQYIMIYIYRYIYSNIAYFHWRFSKITAAGDLLRQSHTKKVPLRDMSFRRT